MPGALGRIRRDDLTRHQHSTVGWRQNKVFSIRRLTVWISKEKEKQRPEDTKLTSAPAISHADAMNDTPERSIFTTRLSAYTARRYLLATDGLAGS